MFLVLPDNIPSIPKIQSMIFGRTDSIKTPKALGFFQNFQKFSKSALKLAKFKIPALWTCGEWLDTHACQV